MAQGLPPEEAMMLAAAGGATGGAPGGMDPAMMAMGGGVPDEAAMLSMMFEQVVGGMQSTQARISGAQDMLMDALMQAAAATAPPDPNMLMPVEGVPMGAGPAPMGPPAPAATEADMLAQMV